MRSCWATSIERFTVRVPSVRVGNLFTVLTPGSSLSYGELTLALLYGRIIIHNILTCVLVVDAYWPLSLRRFGGPKGSGHGMIARA